MRVLEREVESGTGEKTRRTTEAHPRQSGWWRTGGREGGGREGGREREGGGREGGREGGRRGREGGRE